MSGIPKTLGAGLCLLLAGCTADRIPGPTAMVADVAARASSAADWEWSEPVHLDAPISSEYRELAPELSPDNLSLYFNSDRPGSVGGANDFDLWAVRRACEECPWGEPVHLAINSAAGDAEARFSPDGHVLYFASGRPGGKGDSDIWVSVRDDVTDDLGWSEPVNLGGDVNTEGHEGPGAFVPALNGEGATMYVTKGGAAIATFDIYRALVSRDGTASTDVVAVDELNVAGVLDGGGAVSHDGRELFFWRGGSAGGLYTATRNAPRGPWSTPVRLGGAIASRQGDQTVGLSHDGRTLVWASAITARASLGRQDLWMSTRRRP